jgi:hypothetical protein
MEELCDKMSGMIPVHDPQDEYSILYFSSSISLVELSESVFLVNTFDRYKKYLRYIDFSSKNEYYGNIVFILINDFISLENTNYNLVVLAARCVAIDELIIKLLNTVNDNYNSDEENYDSY